MTATATSSAELLRSLYRTMLTIRRFEELALDLRTQEVAQGSMHLCAGQEAVPAGALSVLGADDRVASTYRGHGWAIACGVPLDALLAEICQRATGINGGRGGAGDPDPPPEPLRRGEPLLRRGSSHPPRRRP